MVFKWVLFRRRGVRTVKDELEPPLTYAKGNHSPRLEVTKQNDCFLDIVGCFPSQRVVDG
jgi:hypothetical protein